MSFHRSMISAPRAECRTRENAIPVTTTASSSQGQRSSRNVAALIDTRVINGSSASRSVKNSAKRGMTKMPMTRIMVKESATRTAG